MQNINSHEMCLSPLDKRPELGLGRRMEQVHGRDCLMVRILFEKVSALLPRTSLLKGEEEKDQVALGENPGEYDIAEGKRRARQRSVVDWVYFLEKFSEMKVERHYD